MLANEKKWAERRKRNRRFMGTQPAEPAGARCAFGAAFNMSLVHETVRAELNARRQGTSSTKTRGEVRGGGAKLNDQKCDDENAVVTTDALANGIIKLSAGKKRHAIVKVAD